MQTPPTNFWKPNIDRRGRLARLIPGIVLCIIGLALGIWVRWWLGLVLVAGGGFMIFEASRSWCVIRACGIKTKI